ncbi:MFS transporter [Bacillus mojavensis]|nr:MFS transporter [Bacillus mojavensis]
MGTDLFVVSPLLPFISQAYKISSATAGWMVTVFAITYAISAPFFGWLSDKKGRRSFITLGLLLFAASNILTACAPSFLWLIVSRILAGFSVASITPLIYAIILRYRTTKPKGNMAFNRCFWSLNSPLGWNTTRYIVGTFSRLAFCIYCNGHTRSSIDVCKFYSMEVCS